MNAGTAPILVSSTTEEKAQPYVEALRISGVAPERIRVLHVLPEANVPKADAVAMVREAAGLVLCGGPDLDPRYYGEEPHPEANLTVVPERDELEWELMTAARDASVPTFGVCRGMQILNAFLGGTLYQDLRLMWPGSLLHALSFPRDALIHDLQVVAPDTSLGQVLSREVPIVNSRHHQAAKRLADDLLTVAVAPDGIVEAAVGRHEGWWVWAVQWHPENLISLPLQRALWERFVAVVDQHPIAAAAHVSTAGT